jgi:hypothetical protein
MFVRDNFPSLNTIISSSLAYLRAYAEIMEALRHKAAHLSFLLK